MSDVLKKTETLDLWISFNSTMVRPTPYGVSRFPNRRRILSFLWSVCVHPPVMSTVDSILGLHHPRSLCVNKRAPTIVSRLYSDRRLISSIILWTGSKEQSRGFQIFHSGKSVARSDRPRQTIWRTGLSLYTHLPPTKFFLRKPKFFCRNHKYTV